MYDLWYKNKRNLYDLDFTVFLASDSSDENRILQELTGILTSTGIPSEKQLYSPLFMYMFCDGLMSLISHIPNMYRVRLLGLLLNLLVI